MDVWQSENSDTAGSNSTARVIYKLPHRCSVRETHRRANQHLTTAYGVCDCGRLFTRQVWWSRKSESAWNAAVED